MCGIAGVIAHDPENLRPLPAMTRALAHRGPDDEGLLVAHATAVIGRYATDKTRAFPELPRFSVPHGPKAPYVGFGHRRLSIVDLSSGGFQPMVSAADGAVLAYNGEIYNYIELREELRALGHVFSSGSDSEVILAAWREWGEAALSRFNGMFAFAIFDPQRQAVFIARDRFGVKPLYYHAREGLFAFASEIRAFAHHPGIPFEHDDRTLAGFLIDGLLDEGERTFFEGVSSLAPGSCLTIDLKSLNHRISRWYELRADPPESDLETGQFLQLFEDSVRLRLRSDVEVGTCLSGGLDSSSIVASTARIIGGSPGKSSAHSSFSVVYADRGLVEEPFIDAVVARTGVTSHRVTPLSRDFQEDFDAFIRSQDEPVPSLGMYSQYAVMKLAHSRGIKVLLDGQGADELLAGYHYQLGPFLAETWKRRGVLEALGQARAIRSVTGRSLAFLTSLGLYHAFSWPPAVIAGARRRFRTHGSLDPGLFDPGFAKKRGGGDSERHLPCPTLRAERHRDLLRTSLPALLRYEDRNSMAFGIEARLPFLDYRLVEASFALPASSLVRDGFTKRILRDAMEGRLPDEVRLRRDKLGFPTPEVRWLEESDAFVRERLEEAGDLGGRLRPEAAKELRRLKAHDLARTPGLVRLLSSAVWRQRTRARVASESVA